MRGVAQLTRAVNLLDKSGSMFAPHERLKSSRHRLIDEVRREYKLKDRVSGLKIGCHKNRVSGLAFCLLTIRINLTLTPNFELRFVSIGNIEGLLSLDNVNFSTDINGEKDYGNIESLEKTTSGFLIEGDFGVVVIESNGIEFEIKT